MPLIEEYISLKKQFEDVKLELLNQLYKELNVPTTSIIKIDYVGNHGLLVLDVDTFNERKYKLHLSYKDGVIDYASGVKYYLTDK